MTDFKTDVVYKVTQEAKGRNSEMGNLYFKNVPVNFAQVLKAGKKYNSDDTAYSLHLFVTPATMKKLDKIGVNKEMAEVGVTTIKKGKNRGQIKYDLDEHNEPYEGMFAAQFTRDTVKRDKEGKVVKKYQPLRVVDTEGEDFTEEVGNGSICHVKLFGYRNEEDMLVVMLDTVVVVDHVPYERGGDSFDEELGITLKSGKKAAEETEDTPDNEEEEEEEFIPRKRGASKGTSTKTAANKTTTRRTPPPNDFDDDIPF